MSLADDLQRIWYQPGARVPWWGRPLAVLFRAASAVRRWLYRHRWLKSVRMPVPVIVVGNLSVGGAGKTPLTIALVEALRARGYSPGVVSRGYRAASREPLLLGQRPDPAQVGDEPALIRLRTGVAVAIGAKRPDAARLLAGCGVDVIVADDGLQHYALARDVEICVVDGVRRFGNGRLLPIGPLREPLARLRDVDFIVCNGGHPHAGEVPMRLDPDVAETLAAPAQSRPLASFAGSRVHAVAGIGRPARFFSMLREHDIEVVEHPFADHRGFSPQDLDFGDGLPVLMTEKDAVKCVAFAQPHWWLVPVSAVLPETFFDAIAKHLPTA